MMRYVNFSPVKSACMMNARGAAADDKVDISSTRADGTSFISRVLHFSLTPLHRFRVSPIASVYMIISLGISPNFKAIDFEELTFPAVASVDYVRMYQGLEDVNTGCDSDDFSMQTYINKWVPVTIYSCLAGS